MAKRIEQCLPEHLHQNLRSILYAVLAEERRCPSIQHPQQRPGVAETSSAMLNGLHEGMVDGKPMKVRKWK